MQATSDQAKPAATMNTCGAMMVGSNQSKDPCNDGTQAQHVYYYDAVISLPEPVHNSSCIACNLGHVASKRWLTQPLDPSTFLWVHLQK